MSALDKLTLDELYLRYVRAGNADSGDYALAIKWALDFYYNQGKRYPLTIYLNPRTYNCATPINLHRGEYLRLEGTGGYILATENLNTASFPNTPRYHAPTLKFSYSASVIAAGYAIRSCTGINPVVVSNWDGPFIGTSGLEIRNIAIQGAGWTNEDLVDGIRVRSQVYMDNVRIYSFSRHGIDARSNVVQPDVDELYGGANNIHLNYVSIGFVGGCGFITDGGDTNGSQVIGMDVNYWGANPNYASGTSAAGTSNCAAIWDSSFIMSTYVACHTGANDNGHWHYVAVDPGTFTVFDGCYQETVGDSAIMFANYCVGGIIDATKPPVVIQPESGMHPSAIGQRATVNRHHGSLLQGQYTLPNPSGTNVNSSQRNYKDLLKLGPNQNVAPGADTNWIELHGDGYKTSRTIAATACAVVSNVATATVSAGHNVLVGERISTSGFSVNPAAEVVVSAVTATTISYPLTTADAALGPGTILYATNATDISPWQLQYQHDPDRPGFWWKFGNGGSAAGMVFPSYRVDPSDPANNHTDYRYMCPLQFPFGIRLGGGGPLFNFFLNGESGDPAVISGATRGGNAVICLTTDAALAAAPDARKQAFGFAAAIPTAGTWVTGDVLFDSTGTSPGWRCTAGGTPGTWVANT